MINFPIENCLTPIFQISLFIIGKWSGSRCGLEGIPTQKGTSDIVTTPDLPQFFNQFVDAKSKF